MPDEPPITQQAQGSYIAQATHGGTATVQVVLPPAPVQEQNRVRFLARLRSQYDELWEQSLQGVALMTLGLTEKPDAVLRHSEVLYRAPKLPERPLPEGTSIVNVYDKAGQELLILGEPGVGKSTLLLDLARQLVGRAEQDAGHPLPIIFPLSSWAEKQQPLLDWLPTQLHLIYDVPLQLSRAWVFTNQILPLLDGLDEVPQEARLACIEAITTYRKEHLVPLVVCSRRTEYEEIKRQKRLVLQTAVVVQPLTRQQVETYLDQAGQSLAAVRTVLHANPVLQELTTTPLMLSVLTLTYIGAYVQDLPQRGSAEVQQQQVFASYVERMVERKGNVERYPLQSTQAWLDWLARQMREHNQSVFYLEYLQPDQLAPEQYRIYTWLAIRLPGILIGVLTSFSIVLLLTGIADVVFLIRWGVLGALVGGLFSGASAGRVSPLPPRGIYRRQERYCLIGGRIALSIMIGLIAGLSIGLRLGNGYGPDDWLREGSIWGAFIGLSSLLLQFLVPVVSHRTWSSTTSRKSHWQRLAGPLQTVHGHRALLVAVVIGLSIGLSVGLDNGLVLGLAFDLHTGLGNGLSYGLIFGVISVLVSRILEVQAEGVHLTERLRWTWSSLMRSLLAPTHLRTTLLLASVIAVSAGLSNGLSYELSSEVNGNLLLELIAAASDGLSGGLGVGLGYWMVLGLIGGISSERIEDHSRHRPNQGIRRSLRTSVLMALISGTVIWLISILGSVLYIEVYYGLSVRLSQGQYYGLPVRPDQALIYALHVAWVIGLCGGLLVGVVNGGLAALRHYVIRLLLWRTHTFPWNVPRFLDDATTRILLRRVGGGYSFVHRLILDYFASLDTRPTEPALSHLSQAVPSRVCVCGYQEAHPEAQLCPNCGRPIGS